MKVIIQVDGTTLGDACKRHFPGSVPKYVPAVLRVTEGRAIGLLLSHKPQLIGFTPIFSRVVEVDRYSRYPIVHVALEFSADKPSLMPFIRASSFKGVSGEMLDAYGAPGLLRDFLIHAVDDFPLPDNNITTPYERPQNEK